MDNSKNKLNKTGNHQDQDASSLFQDSLPTTSDNLLIKLKEWKIKFKLIQHVPLRTVEESKQFHSQSLMLEKSIAQIKNLYLRDHKKNNFLFVFQQDKKIDLKKLSEIIKAGRLSFGSKERLFENLGVRPGAVTPFAMINGIHKHVNLYLDLNLRSYEKLYAHPLVNDRTIEVKLEDLENFFNKIGVKINWIQL